jgi:hypothetical protein
MRHGKPGSAAQRAVRRGRRTQTCDLRDDRRRLRRAAGRGIRHPATEDICPAPAATTRVSGTDRRGAKGNRGMRNADKPTATSGPAAAVRGMRGQSASVAAPQTGAGRCRNAAATARRPRGSVERAAASTGYAPSGGMPRRRTCRDASPARPPHAAAAARRRRENRHSRYAAVAEAVARARRPARQRRPPAIGEPRASPPLRSARTP